MSLIDRYRLPITALDAETLASAFLDFLEAAYGGALDRDALTRIEQAQVDYTALGIEAAMRVGERAAGEASLASAVESQSILDHAFTLFEYTPPGDVAARYAVTFTGPVASTVIIPAGTVVTTTAGGGGVRQTFEVEAEVVKTSGNTTVTGVVRHGQTNTQNEESDGSPGQIFELVGSGVDTSTVEVTVQGEVWERVSSFSSSRPFDKHYRLRALEFVPGNRRYQVLFGDGVLGLIPQAGDDVTIVYVSGAGTSGNVSSGSINRVVTELVDGFGNPTVIDVINTGSLTRGRRHEHVDITRIKAPLRENVRFSVVSKRDYEAAAMLVPGGAIRAKAFNWEDLGPLWDPNSVLLFVAVDFENPPTVEEAEEIRTKILDLYNSNGTARLVVAPCVFESATVTLTVTLDAGYLVSEMTPIVDAVVAEFLGVNSTEGPVPSYVVDIGKPLKHSALVGAIEGLEGVDKVALPDVGSFDVIAVAFNALLMVTPVITYEAATVR